MKKCHHILIKKAKLAIIKHDTSCSPFQINNFDHALGLWYGFFVDFMDQINENEGEPVK